jgi:predicted nucleic acid-binding protein
LLSLRAYDASYLLLARQMQAEVVTLDTELAGAAAKSAKS